MGQKYAAFNTAGVITAFYDDVDSPVPVWIKTTVKITDVQWQALLNGQTQGEVIQLDANGMPTVIALPAPSQADLMTATRVQARVLRQPAISILDGMQASAISKGDAATATAIETAKQGLRDITKIDLSSYTTLAQMKAAVVAQYQNIAAALPIAVRTAFAGSLS